MTSSHVQCKSSNISETVQYGNVIIQTAQSYDISLHGLSNHAISDDIDRLSRSRTYCKPMKFSHCFAAIAKISTEVGLSASRYPSAGAELIMVALIGQTIIFSSCFFFLSFPRLISAVGDWMSTILPHMVWL